MADSQKRPGETEVAYTSRLARERGERGRREAEQRGADARAPAVQRGEEGRRGPIERGQRERSKAELRGAMRRVAHLNRLAPPPADVKTSESMQKIQNNNPIRRFFQAVDKARGKQKEEGKN